MKNFAKKSSLFVVAGIVYLAGAFFSNPSTLGFCVTRPYVNNFCLADTAINIGWPLIATGEIFAIIAIILLFANERGIHTWWRMSRWFVPIATLIIIFFAPFPLLPVVAPISRAHITWFFGFLYILITLWIVIWDYVASR